jgi:hypothetical protein
VLSTPKTSDLRELRAALLAALPPGSERAGAAARLSAFDETYWRD